MSRAKMINVFETSVKLVDGKPKEAKVDNTRSRRRGPGGAFRGKRPGPGERDPKNNWGLSAEGESRIIMLLRFRMYIFRL